ncbi:MAG: hypothetical protein IKM68_09560 [Bacteroidaceae bacterium]|nr:hypothetical protein [Bacteroidaceae bacterium]
MTKIDVSSWKTSRVKFVNYSREVVQLDISSR